MALFALIPILYFSLIIGSLVFFFWIFYGIRRASKERNEILRGIHEELKNANASKSQLF